MCTCNMQVFFSLFRKTIIDILLQVLALAEMPAGEETLYLGTILIIHHTSVMTCGVRFIRGGCMRKKKINAR